MFLRQPDEKIDGAEFVVAVLQLNSSVGPDVGRRAATPGSLTIALECPLFPGCLTCFLGCVARFPEREACCTSGWLSSRGAVCCSCWLRALALGTRWRGCCRADTRYV